VAGSFQDGALEGDYVWFVVNTKNACHGAQITRG
jgi:hypothetical protein